MIVGKMWRAFKAQMNKLANFAWGADPVAQMQYEYDRMVDQLKEGRQGLEQFQALVARVTRQVEADKKHVSELEAKTKAYLGAGDRGTAAKFALELQKAKQALAENEGQLAVQQQGYTNNLTKIQHASGKLAQLREKILKYDADLKMSRAEAELAKIGRNFKVDITTDFGQIEQVLQEEIDRNRAKAKVAADLSSEGLEEIRHDQAVENALAEQALREFEMQSLPAPKVETPKVEDRALAPIPTN
jgi:phage shock protein A